MWSFGALVNLALLIPIIHTTQCCTEEKQGRPVGTKPNIIFFLVDDLGYNDVGYHDCTVKTPNIDALAKTGITLENNYMAPLCSPSRGALLTGKYAFLIGQQHAALQDDTPECLTKKDPIMPVAMKKLGYKTYMLGKWHEGFCNISCTPTRRGFDEFYGFYNGHAHHFTHMTGGFYDWRDGEEVDFSAYGKYDVTILRDRANKWIEDHAAKQKDDPMFMYFAFPTVHSPVEAPSEYVQMYKDEPDLNRRLIKAMVTATDDAIGAVIRQLKVYGMYENSVIVFSSDNGGEAGFSSNYPLRGAKATSWEGGVRVPGAFHSPLMSRHVVGTVSKELFHGTDWYPTFVSLAGGRPDPFLRGYDQTNFLLRGARSSRSVIPIHLDENPLLPSYGRGAIRAGRWKLIKGFPGIFNGYDSVKSGPRAMYQTHMSPDIMTNTVPAITEKFNKEEEGKGEVGENSDYDFDYAAIGRYAQENNDHILLFDLENDPTESRNLADRNPWMVKQLLFQLQNFMAAAVPPTPESELRWPERSDPRKTGGAWSPGWCDHSSRG